MKSFAEFKRALKIGTLLHALHHGYLKSDNPEEYSMPPKDMGVREVSIVQTNSIALKTTKNNGKVVDSWVYWPKASEAKVNGNILELYENGRCWITYKIIQPN